LIYLLLCILLQCPHKAMATRCCPQKMVGGVAYQLVEEDEDTSMYGCKENCIYTKDNEDERICFKEGSGSVQCFENVTACVDSSNCSPGQECDLITNYCVKEESGCKEMKSRQIYPAGTVKTEDCFIYHCLPSNNTWSVVEQDPTCCLVNGSTVPNNWTGQVGQADGICRNGSLEVETRFVEEKLMENITVTKEDLSLAFETYISVCRDDAKTTQSSSDYFMNLMKKKSEECYDAKPIKDDTTVENQRTVYYFDGESCQAISAVSGQDTSNQFSSSYLCEALCVDRCSHKLLAGPLEEKDCTEAQEETRWYWDGAQCKSFRFYGCNLNGNNFHEKDECETWCGGKIKDGQMIIKENDEETRQFCENYEKEHPGIKKMLEITNDVKNPQIKGRLLKVMNGVIHSPQSLKRHKRQIELDIDNILNELQSLLENGDLNLETLSELLDQLENLDSTFETINEEIIPYLLEIGEDIPRRLWWSSVLSTNCSETKIRIRYHCLKNPIEIFNITDEMFDKICDDLIPAGIKKYYERSINIEGEPRQLMIEPLRVPTFLFAKTFIIGTYCNLGSVFGINPFLYLPTSVWVCKDYLSSYRSDDVIAQIAAQELGHDILWTIPEDLEDAWRWSWFHKNTSSLTQPLPSAPMYPSTLGPGEELDLMIYYNSNPAITNTTEITDMIIDNTKLAEEDAVALYEKSLIRLNVTCGQERCAPCVNDITCQEGLTCSLFRCVDCADDSQCPGDQFCFGKVLPWVCNECRAPQPDGAWCLEDSQCENVCSGGRCGPCKAHSDCPGEQFCRNLLLPGIPNNCSTPQPNGAFCLDSQECEESCSLGVCSECTKDSDCEDGEFCRNKILPLIMNKCSSPLANGELCSEDSDCINNHCDGFVCGACGEDADCGEGQYCMWKNIPLIENKCEDVCGRSCLFDTNCGENGSECNKCSGGFFDRRCTKLTDPPPPPSILHFYLQ